MYTPAFRIDSRFENYFRPTMVTDKHGELHQDILNSGLLKESGCYSDGGTSCLKSFEIGVWSFEFRVWSLEFGVQSTSFSLSGYGAGESSKLKFELENIETLETSNSKLQTLNFFPSTRA